MIPIFPHKGDNQNGNSRLKRKLILVCVDLLGCSFIFAR